MDDQNFDQKTADDLQTTVLNWAKNRGINGTWTT
jgi:hypothetical protein